MAIVLVIVGAIGVYAAHPWRPAPVLQPAGLVSKAQTANSVTLDWSSPASGPLPGSYEILLNGTPFATVPGDVNHFDAGNLWPATKYDFRVIAYRGHVRSRSSHDLYIATSTPPLSAAVFASSPTVNETLKSGGSEFTYSKNDGDTWPDSWTFTSNCTTGPCPATLDGAVDGEQFTATLTASANGDYTGSVAVNDYFVCGSNTTDYLDSTLSVQLTPAAASPSGTTWAVSKFSGSMTWNVDASSDGSCTGGALTYGVRG